MSTVTLKSYNISSVGSNLELGKRGGMVKYDLINSKFVLYKSDKITLSPLQIGDAVNNDEALTKGQLSSALQEVSGIPRYDVVSTSITIEVGKKYYLTANQTLTLPDTSTVSIGDTIIIRSSNAVSSGSITVNDILNDLIITTAGSSTSFTIDTMTETKMVYAGSNYWELLNA